jgi:hypothetical protein
MAVDKKYIEALHNFADALEQLADALLNNEPSGKTGDGVGDGSMLEINNTLISISQSIEEIKDDTKNIKETSSETLKIAKEIQKNQNDGGLFGGADESKKSSALKDGIGTIILIAGAVLAVGMAFKLIGKVDFLSVIAIGLSLVAISMAFEKISKLGIDVDQAAEIGFMLVIMSVAITTSSLILSFVQDVTPIQLLTAVAIAFALSVISYGVASLVNAVDGISLAELLMIPITMILLAGAIAISSYLLSDIKVITSEQLITAVAIALAMGIISYGVGKLAGVGVNFISVSISMILLAGAIAISSYLLNLTEPVPAEKLFNIVMIAATLAISSLLMALPIYVLSKLLSPIDALKGSISMVLVAGAIAISSLILGIGNYDEPPPSLEWTINASLSLAIFSIPVILLGLIAQTGAGGAAILLGALAIPLVALAITTSSLILSKGNYSGGPSLEWSKSVSLLLVTFGSTMTVLGSLIAGTLGVGAIAIAAGALAVLGVAETIVKVSEILSKGNYSGGPTKEWAEGIGIAIGAFAPVFNELNKSKVFSLFGGDPLTGESFANTMVIVGKSIVDVAELLEKSNVKWVQGPTKEWAEGIGIAIGAFAPVFNELNKSKVMSIFGGDPLTGETYGDTMVSIGRSILKVAELFSSEENKGIWGVYPTKEWGEGIGMAISAFAPIYAAMETSIGDIIGDLFGLGKDKGKQMSNAMIDIAGAIIDVGKKFNTDPIDWENAKGPKKEWAESVSVLISAFSNTYLSLDDIDEDYIDEKTPVLLKIVDSIKTIGLSFKEDEITQISNTTNSISNLADSFIKLSQSLDKLDISMKSLGKLNIEGGVVFTTSYTVGSSNVENQSIVKGDSESIKTTKTEIVDMNDKKISDLYQQMEFMNAQLSQIVNNSGNLSDYIDEIRAQGGSVKINH